MAMTRVLALFMTAPVLSRSEIPNTVKIGAAGALTLTMYQSIIGNSTGFISLEPWEIFMTLVYEIFIGGAIGFMSNLLFEALATFMHIAGIQMGESSASIFNPISRSVLNPIASFYLYFALMIFLTMNGLYMILGILLRSFELIPLASFSVDMGILAERFIPIFQSIFLSALSLSLPLISVMFITDIFVSLIAKILPQANIYFLLMPNKLFLGMIVMSITIAGFSEALGNFYSINLLELFSDFFA
jgi:flagellar biosynthesis protein FliR